jgi:hypothetical protein
LHGVGERLPQKGTKGTNGLAEIFVPYVLFAAYIR